jgi:hypothetical protein
VLFKTAAQIVFMFYNMRANIVFNFSCEVAPPADSAEIAQINPVWSSQRAV